VWATGIGRVSLFIGQTVRFIEACFRPAPMPRRYRRAASAGAVPAEAQPGSSVVPAAALPGPVSGQRGSLGRHECFGVADKGAAV
jgi:hypothetical protein